MFNFYILDLGRKEVGEKALKDRRESILKPVRRDARKSCELGGL